jgi:hypothetical protein
MAIFMTEALKVSSLPGAFEQLRELAGRNDVLAWKHE